MKWTLEDFLLMLILIYLPTSVLVILISYLIIKSPTLTIISTLLIPAAVYSFKKLLNTPVSHVLLVMIPAISSLILYNLTSGILYSFTLSTIAGIIINFITLACMVVAISLLICCSNDQFIKLMKFADNPKIPLIGSILSPILLSTLLFLDNLELSCPYYSTITNRIYINTMYILTKYGELDILKRLHTILNTPILGAILRFRRIDFYTDALDNDPIFPDVGSAVHSLAMHTAIMRLNCATYTNTPDASYSQALELCNILAANGEKIGFSRHVDPNHKLYFERFHIPAEYQTRIITQEQNIAASSRQRSLLPY